MQKGVSQGSKSTLLFVLLSALVIIGVAAITRHVTLQTFAPPADTAPLLTQAASMYWQERFPLQVASYMRTLEMEATAHAGSVPYQKLTKYPFMRAMYHGFGFWFDLRRLSHAYG